MGKIAAKNALEILDNDPNLVRISSIIYDTQQGNARKAYRAGYDIKWLGASFLSKLLYFAGRDAGFNPIPLILDTRVAKALRRLGHLEGWSLGLFADLGVEGTSVQHDETRYGNYIRGMHAWANQLKCPKADSLEYFLFRDWYKIPEH